MSFSGETDRAGRTRRTQFWTLLTLLIAVGGLSLVSSGSAPSLAATPFSGSAHLSPHLAGWVPLTISSYAASPNPAFVNNVTTISATVSGGQGGYTYSYSGLPAGCSSANSASIACTPTARGNSTVVLTVNDTGGNVTKNAFILQTNAFTISSFLVSPAVDSLGSSITFTATYGGASGVVTWGWSGLPAGCTAPAGKAFVCTPTVAGTFTVTLTGTDASLAANAKSVTVRVTPVSISSFSVSPSSDYTGQSATFSASITGTTGPVTYSYAGLPIGCSSQNLASLPCVARVAGTYTVTVTATDSAGDTSARSATLTVKPLTITSWVATPATAYELTVTKYTVTAFGWLGVVVSGSGTAGYPIYSYTGLPAGCPSANKTQIICKPTVQGTFVVNVTVSDPTGNHTSASLTMIVNPAAQPELYVPVSTSFSDPATNVRTCQNTNNAPFYSSTCYLQAQDPTVLALGPTGAITGIGYAVYTNATNNTCAGAAANTNSRLAFSLSSNNGTTFTSTVLIGDAASCAYLDAIEPSFGANRAGAIFGAFIEEASPVTTLPSQYVARGADALGFVTSLSGGVSFSAARTLDASGNLAQPVLAVYGNTIYIVYEDIANSSTPMPGGALPISLKFIESSNGGLTWSVPTLLNVGQNASSGFNAMSPSLAVSSSGELALAYATDRSCIAHVGAPATTACLHYGSNVDVVTSASNGTSWSAPSVASTGVPQGYPTGTSLVRGTFLGETTCMVGACLPSLFQGTPETAIAFNAGGTKIFVAWAGTVNASVAPNSNFWWRWSGVGVSGSSTNGATWTGGVAAAPDGSASPTVATNHTNYYHPAIGIQGSQLYLTYSVDNETNITGGIGKLYPGPFDNSFSQWANNATIAASGAALTWNSPEAVSLLPISTGRLTNFTGNSFTGYRSSIGFAATGAPILAYSFPETPSTTTVTRAGYYSVNVTYATNLTVVNWALVGMPQVVGVTFSTYGLPAGQTWGFLIDGQLVSTNQSAILVLNVPKGIPVFLKQIPLKQQVGEVISQTGSFPAQTTFFFNTTLTITFAIWVTLNVSPGPSVFSIVGAGGCGSFCYMYYEPFWYTYECLNVPGRTCNTVPATTTENTCGYTYQVGCYFFELQIFQYYYQSGTYVDTENYTFQYMYYDTPTGYVFWEYEAEYYCYGNPGSLSCNSYVYNSNPVTFNWLPTASNVPHYLYPFWVPLGISFAYQGQIYSYGFSFSIPQVPSYASGTGLGSFTGKMTQCGVYSCPPVWFTYYFYEQYHYCQSYAYSYCDTSPIVVINGPVNETVWFIPSVGASSTITYPMEVTPVGLPTGTSYSFKLLGTKYTATAPNAVFIPNVPAGNTTITGGTAPGASPGWTWFAPPVPVSIPTSVFVNLTFSTSIDFLAPARPVTLHALNLTAGTAWAAEFNGTFYSSVATSIVLSANPGNYSFLAYNTTSPSGDAVYVPHNPTTIPLVTKTQFNVSFTPSYRLAVSASLGGTVEIGKGKVGPSATVMVGAGVPETLTATAQPNYGFLGWSGTGTGSYSGSGTPSGSQNTASVTVNGPILETAAFALLPQARFNLSFTSVGIPDGVWWTVYLNDGRGPVGYSSNHATLTVPGVYGFAAPNKLGIYTLTVAYAYVNGTNGTRYIPGGYPATVATNGTVTATQISWSSEYELTLAATPGGSVAGAIGNLPISAGTYWVSSNEIVSAQATVPDPVHYRFVGWNGTGPGSVPSSLQTTIQFTPTGPVMEVAQFVENPPVIVPTYTVEFLIGTTVATGTAWSVTVGSAQFSSTSLTLNATGIRSGTYAVSVKTAVAPGGATRYVPHTGTIATVTVNGANLTERLVFDTQYWVSIGASVGGNVSATQGGASGGAATLSGWYAPNTQLVLTATPQGTYLFAQWTGLPVAPGGTNSTDPTTTVAVSGPINAVASFVPPAPAVKTQAGFIGSTMGWVVFAVLGLVVGLAIGLVAVRMGSRPRAPPPEMGGGEEEMAAPAADVDSDGMTDASMGEGTSPEGGGGPETDYVENPGGDQ